MYELPCLVLGVCLLVSFCIPFSLGERIGFAATLSLAIVVFLLTIAESIPKTDEIPMLEMEFQFLVYSSIFLTGLVIEEV
jgi:hypothetical protein